jgi:hypothetical protein
MIISVWKPTYLKSKVFFYTLVQKDEFLEVKGKTNYKVIWTCDNPDCKNPNLIHSISACHLKKDKLNCNLQICRPCQCTGEGNGRFGDNRKWSDILSEEKLKTLKKIYSDRWSGKNNPSLLDYVKSKKGQAIINEEFIKKKLESKNFKLINIEKLDGKKTLMNVCCPKNHKTTKKYCNFFSKQRKFICERCYYDSLELKLSEEEIKEFKKYEKIVRLNTSKNYRKYKDIINPKNLILKRGHNNLDHKYSISQGFIDKVPPKIISSVENLEILTEQENLIKGKKCSIILSELIEKTKYL